MADNSRYPKYQHERRIDIFISFFLRSILERVLNEEISRVIPEFPFKKDSSFATTNIDYFAYSSVAKTAYFVELKTDTLSFDNEQMKRYLEVANKPWDEIVDDIKQIRTRSNLTSYKEKYDILLEQLRDMHPEIKRVVYLVPQKLYAKLSAYKDRVIFFTLEDISRMSNFEQFNDEWNIVRDYLCKQENSMSLDSMNLVGNLSS